MSSQLKLSNLLCRYLKQKKIFTHFGVPGAYSIDFVDAISRDNDLKFYLASHEGGAAFMAQGYSQTSTNKIGSVITTAGPGAMNTIVGLAGAKSDGDRIILTHGEVPNHLRNAGALQDSSAYNCDILQLMNQVSVSQRYITSNTQFPSLFKDLENFVSPNDPLTPYGPFHLCVPMDVFTKTSSEDILLSNESPKNFQIDFDPAILEEAQRKLFTAQRPLVLVGKGVLQSNASQLVEQFLIETGIPFMTTARGVSAVDNCLANYVGQFSLFPHGRSIKFLEEIQPDLLIVLGSSLGEYPTNGWSTLLTRIPEKIIVNKDSNSFTRISSKPEGGKSTSDLGIQSDIRTFMGSFLEVIRKYPSNKRTVLSRNIQISNGFFASHPSLEMSRFDSLICQSSNPKLTGQKLVHEVGKCLKELFPSTHVNIVADTGCSKMYASHYITYPPGWNCLIAGGGIDSMGFGLCGAIGAALGSYDSGKEAITVCFTGDGSFLMNNEILSLSSNSSIQNCPLLIFVLNDGALSYVHQGFAAITNQPLEATRFSKQVDFQQMAQSVGLPCVTISSAEQITSSFLANLISKRTPILIDCRIDGNSIGPGYDRYNIVRERLNLHRLSVEEMSRVLSNRSPAQESASSQTPSQTTTGRSLADPTYQGGIDAKETFHQPLKPGEKENRVHLYGHIMNVFEGIIDEQVMKERGFSGISNDLRFGLGVSSFESDPADVGDAVFFNGKFFVRRTEEGIDRANKALNISNARHFATGSAAEYRTGYSLGIEKYPDEMEGVRYLYSSDCHGKKSLRDLLTEMIGNPLSAQDEPGRIIGYMGLMEYHNFLGTSLRVPPSRGENILAVIDDYARPSIPNPNRCGVAMGFLRTTVFQDENTKKDDPFYQEQLRLYHRMFYNNPRDGDGLPGPSPDGDAHWISHSHGVLFHPGQSLFSYPLNLNEETNFVEQQPGDNQAANLFEKLKADRDFRKKFLAEKVFSVISQENIADIGHVIPTSSLARYFLITFPVHKVKVHNPNSTESLTQFTKLFNEKVKH